MTVSSTTTKNSYSGNGSTTVFAYGFKVFDEDDLTVILRTDATGTETVQTKTTHYTVSGVGSASGGNVTFGTAPASGVTVVIRRASPLTQTTDYTPNDPFPAASHEDALDNLTFIAQQQQEEIDRAIKLSRTNTMTSTEFTVGATDRANKILAFDSSGEISVTQELGTFVGDWAASTSYNARDIVKDTSTNNIFICTTSHTSSGSQPLTTNTDSGKWALLVDAASATTSASAAATSATAAASSATAAASSASSATSSASSATSSASTASTAATAAQTAQSAAETAETNAETAETNAETAETNAASSATAASNSATAAASSASTASGHATTATTKASEAATSATNAATSASTASTQATNASNSASTATTKASEASTSATNAASSATAAASSATAAAASLDAFDDLYLGAKSSDPTVDNDGDALTAGDLYFNTTSDQLKYYTGSAWVAIAPGIANVSDDTSPQLGGNLDLNSNDITGTGNISTTGSATFTTADNTAQLTLKSTDADANSGPIIDLVRDSGSPADGDEVGIIRFKFDDDAGEVNTAARFTAKINDASNGTEDGELEIVTLINGSSRSRIEMLPTETVINEDSQDIDFRVESDGNANMLTVNAGDNRVGIGCDPERDLHVKGASGDPVHFKLEGDASDYARIMFDDGTDDNIGEIRYDFGSDFMQFTVNAAEKGRIDSNGFHLGGTDNNPQASSSSSGGELYYSTQYAFMAMYRPSNPCLLLNRTNSDGEIVQFRKSGSTVGTVSVTGSGATYNTTSDIRLKQDIEPLEATDKLMAMNPVSYSWKADPDGPRSMGFIAQEMQEVMPEAVGTGDDGMMHMDYGRITPILVSALQDAHRKIEQLEQRLAEMETGNE